MRVAKDPLTTLAIEESFPAQVPSRNRRNYKKLAFNFHSVVGSIAALYVLIISASGATLVFHEEISELLRPATLVSAKPNLCSIADVIAASKRRYPTNVASWIHYSNRPDRACELRLEEPKRPQITIEFDPYTGKLFGEKNIALVPFLEDLHFNLLMGNNGRYANLMGACILMSLACSGLSVWWNRATNWRRRLNIKLDRRYAVPSDMHRTAGSLAFGFLLVWGISGIYFCFPVEFKQVAACVLPFASAPSPIVLTPCAEADLKSPDFLIKEVRAQYPDYTLLWAKIPSAKTPSMSLFLKKRGAESEDGFLSLELDARTARVLSHSEPGDTRCGDKFLGWLSKLHMGTFGGTAIKVLWSVLGTFPCVLAITGICIWRRRKIKPST